MGLDRPDEDDAPTTARRDSPTAERDPVAVDGDPADDSEAARAAYNIEYRALVDAEYAAAPDSWTEAVPALRRIWEDHEKQYPRPERSRPTQHPDGSWHGPGDLKLNSAQNVELARGCQHIREVGENRIIPGMRRIEAEDTSRHLAGVQHGFKEADRLKEKVADQLRSTPGLTPTQALATIPDAVRFTFQYKDENSYMPGVKADIDRLQAHGFIQVERRNTWTSDQYRGINSRWREPESGHIFEVQFHTPASFEAKELTHKAYERIRSTAQDPELAELKEFQRRVCALIPIPPGAAEYDDYPPEERDG